MGSVKFQGFHSRRLLRDLVWKCVPTFLFWRCWSRRMKHVYQTVARFVMPRSQCHPTPIGAWSEKEIVLDQYYERSEGESLIFLP